jgi:hypothetical protein
VSKKVAAAAVAALIVSVFAVDAASADTVECAAPTVRVSAETPSVIQLTGSLIGELPMSKLWQIVEKESSYSTTLLGKVIGQDQDWLGTCQYPGVGIGAGSGTSWQTRNVTLWLWASEVDVAAARHSLLTYVSAIAATTTTTTTPIAVPSVETTTTTATTTEAPEEVSTLFASVAAVNVAAGVATVSKQSVKSSSKKVCRTAGVKTLSKKSKKQVVIKKKVCK